MTVAGEALFALLRLGLSLESNCNNNTDIYTLLGCKKWRNIFQLSIQQGVNAIAADGLQFLLENPGSKELLKSLDAPPLKLQKTQWLGSSLTIERIYEQHKRVMSELAAFYSSHGIKMLVVKGYGLSLNYPVPNHRPLGDIDIWLFGEQKRGDKALSEKGIKIDYGHHHHTIFNYKGITIENYSDFLCVPGHRKNASYERILKRLAYEESIKSEINGEEIYYPSAYFNALFILKHSATHFASTEMNLRQLLDWGGFILKHGKDVDWKMVIKVAKKYNLYRFMSCQNALCVDYLGFPSEVFPEFERNKELETRVLNDILSPEFNKKAPKGFMKGLLFKYERWRANIWKHKITFPESLTETLLTQILAHLLKPASLKN